jgi:hypothetical protein
MPDALSFMEIKRQYVELLPARTVMSMICCTPNTGTTATSSSTAGTTGAASTGGAGTGTTITGNTIFVFFIEGNQYNTLTGGASGTTGAASTGGTATGGAS